MVSLTLALAFGSLGIARILEPEYAVVIVAGNQKLSPRQKISVTQDRSAVEKAFPKAIVLKGEKVVLYFVPAWESIARTEVQTELLAKVASGRSRDAFAAGDLKTNGLVELGQQMGLDVKPQSKTIFEIKRSLRFSHGGKEVVMPCWEQDPRNRTELGPADEVKPRTRSESGSRTSTDEVPDTGYKVMVIGQIPENRHPRISSWALTVLDEYVQKRALDQEKAFLDATKKLKEFSNPADLFGKRVQDFDEKIGKSFIDSAASNFTNYGFSSEGEARSFFRDAEIVGVSDSLLTLWRGPDQKSPPYAKNFIGTPVSGISYRR